MISYYIIWEYIFIKNFGYYLYIRIKIYEYENTWLAYYTSTLFFII